MGRMTAPGGSAGGPGRAAADRLRRLRRIAFVIAAVLWLPGCIDAYYREPYIPFQESTYASLYPYYAEYCALSEFDKKKGFGVPLDSGGPGGHSVFYLNGVCRVRGADYPVLELCPVSPAGMAGRGVGLSVNGHYRNASWTATEGRAFFFRGAVRPGEGVTRADYERTQRQAEAKGILDGVVFHRWALANRPRGMSVRDYKYAISIATDYAVGLARDRYCARVPLDRARMAVIVRYLNALNAPYRSGRKVFHWNVLTDNCAYLAHDALAAVGVWSGFRIGRPLLFAAFDFPVPKNEFVNLVRRTNDLPIGDPGALYDDPTTRAALLRFGWLPTEPGALAEARPALQPNAVYGTRLRLIFYDEPIFGHYQTWFDQIFAAPRYTNLMANLAYFSRLYANIMARPRQPQASPARAAFDRRYYELIAREKAKVDAMRAELAGTEG
jgi:hypothetical protein